MKAEYETPSVPLRNYMYRGWGDTEGSRAAREGEGEIHDVDANALFVTGALMGPEVREASRSALGQAPGSAKCF